MAKTYYPNDDLLYPHPGSVLLGELSEHGVSQRELALAIGKTPAVVNGIIKGDRDINSEIALLLEAALPGPTKAEDWMRMQCAYDLDKARNNSNIESRKKNILAWNRLKPLVKIATIKKKLNLNDNIEENVSSIFGALGVSTVEDFIQKVESISAKDCFKKSEKVMTDTINLLTWIIVVRYRSNAQILEQPFSKDQIPLLKQRLNEIIYENKDTYARTEALLNSFGIKFIKEAKIEKVPVDGYSFWIGNHPTIVMTGRMNRIDNFAFTLFHELGHIEKHLNPNSTEDFLDIVGSDNLHEMDLKEKEANIYATTSIWNGLNKSEIFRKINNPFGASSSLKQIAREHHINLGVVVGQYRYYCDKNEIVRNAYAICQELMEKIN